MLEYYVLLVIYHLLNLGYNLCQRCDKDDRFSTNKNAILVGKGPQTGYWAKQTKEIWTSIRPIFKKEQLAQKILKHKEIDWLAQKSLKSSRNKNYIS